MEVAIPVNPMDFDFNFSSSSYPIAPSTPTRMGEYYCSAPTSPTRLTELYHEFDQLLISPENQQIGSRATIPFAWEEKPGVPKSFFNYFKHDFAFDVGEFDRDSVSAKDSSSGLHKESETKAAGEKRRGRERVYSMSSSGLPSSRRGRRSKSLTPLTSSGYRWEDESAKPQSTIATKPKLQLASSFSTLSVKGSRKWSFKDLFLFRSASDGRAMERDPLKKYAAVFRKHDEDVRNSSLRSIEYPGYGSESGSGSGSSRRGRVSAHELHYTVNRAVSNDMKRKTFLPYRQGILGRLAFNPTVHALANGFGFSKDVGY